MKNIFFKLLFCLIVFVVFQIDAFSQTTIEQQLVVNTNTHTLGGNFIIAVQVKVTNLPIACTLGSETIDLQYDNTKLTYVSGAWNAGAGITLANGYSRTITNTGTVVRVGAVGSSVDGGVNAYGTDLTASYVTWATITFHIASTTTTSITIDPATNQIGLFDTYQNGDGSGGAGTGSITNQTLSTPIVITNVALPVELTSFTASVNRLDAQLEWSTATEVNNYGFEIEKRAVSNKQSTASNWTKIGFVKGNGTSNVKQSYSFSENVTESGRYAYRLKQIDNDGAFKYSQEAEVTIEVPKVFTLNQNYPNPFNPTTTISFTLAQDGITVLRIFDILGREVATLANGDMKAGVVQHVTFDASRLSSGIYFSCLENNGLRQIKKIVLMK